MPAKQLFEVKFPFIVLYYAVALRDDEWAISSFFAKLEHLAGESLNCVSGVLNSHLCVLHDNPNHQNKMKCIKG